MIEDWTLVLKVRVYKDRGRGLLQEAHYWLTPRGVICEGREWIDTYWRAWRKLRDFRKAMRDGSAS